MSRIKKSITELIGNTPLLQLINYEKQNNLEAEVLAKLEYFNPSSSVKDRAAKAMIEDAEEKGLLIKGYTIVEATSGNTGIGAAAIAAAKGYKARIYMQDRVSIERKKAIKAYGADIVYFSEVDGFQEVLDKSQGDFIEALNFLKDKLLNEENIFFLNQSYNHANPSVHEVTTGPEIWEDTNGEVDILISTVGTGGTISGTGTYLKSKNPNIKVVAVEPGVGSVPSENNPEPKEITGVHKFTDVDESKIPNTLYNDIYDEVFQVETWDAYAAAREVAKSEGILVGTSSGAAIYAATEIAKRLENKNKKIVVILPDTGLNYLSTDLFE